MKHGIYIFFSPEVKNFVIFWTNNNIYGFKTCYYCFLITVWKTNILKCELN